MSADHYRKLMSDETDYLNNQITKFNKILDGLTGDNVDSTTTGIPQSPELIESGTCCFHLLFQFPFVLTP